MRPLLSLFVALTVLTGVVYPLSVRLVAMLLFPRQAEGSLIMKNGAVVGSELIGQQFAGDNYFWSRPSATSPAAYNSAASSGSNLSPSNPALTAAVAERMSTFQRFHKLGVADKIPVDMLTTSASGLDPHISVASAKLQISRVAESRRLNRATVDALVTKFIEGRFLGIFGERRVNVLKLNLALDELRG